jgi:hypothetical protein
MTGNGVSNGSPGPERLWPQIERALTDPKFDLRSYIGISTALGAGVEDVKRAVSDNRDAVRFSGLIRDRRGEPLFTLATRPKSWRERVSEVRSLFANLA